tara:strand:- start:2758 stop:3393 length:636 start_codon:yes stop_codon:yes gene_type:complete
MSLATLKKKTKAKYNNVSTNMDGFSINGIHRNQGYVGQSSLGRSLSRAIGNDGVLKGYGGCCGKYTNGPSLKSGIVQVESGGEQLIKQSVMSNREMLSRKTRCCEIIWKAGSSQNTNTQGDYLEYRKQLTQRCIEEKEEEKEEENITTIDPPRNNCYDKKCNVTKPEETFMSITQGEYIMRKKNKCPDLTKEGMYFIHSNGTGIVCAGAST